MSIWDEGVVTTCAGTLRVLVHHVIQMIQQKSSRELIEVQLLARCVESSQSVGGTVELLNDENVMERVCYGSLITVCIYRGRFMLSVD